MEMDKDNLWVERLSNRFLKQLRDKVGEVHVNGSLEHRYKGNLSLRIKGQNANDLIEKCSKELCFSGGAACNSGE